jgi:hypothetical protein
MTVRALAPPFVFVVYDRCDDQVMLSQRIGRLDDWCDQRGARIVGEFVAAGGEVASDYPAALTRAVETTHTMGGALLVHDVEEVISHQPTVVGALLCELAPRELWTPAGRVVVDNLGRLTTITPAEPSPTPSLER